MRWAALLLLLSACGAQPSPPMMGADRAEVTRAGRSYVVFRRDDRAEVIRRGFAGPAAQRDIRAAMLAAVPQATGCAIVEGSWTGDSGLMRGRIRC